jgi:hypothetical protein
MASQRTRVSTEVLHAMRTREQLLQRADRELNRACSNPDNETLEFRRYLVEFAQASIALAAEIRAGEEDVNIEFAIARRKLLESVDT